MNVALSRGWSLDGRNRCAKFGCAAVAVPSGVEKNAAEESTSGSTTVGVAVYWATTTRNFDPLWIGFSGVMTMSSPSCTTAAGRPFTATAP